MSEPIVKQVTGACVAVSERNGFTEFEIDHGGSYTTKMSTKLQPLIELGRAAGKDLAVWTYKESDGKENPQRPGTHFKNRYLEKVEVGGVAEKPVANGSPTSAPPVDWDAKELRDYRSRAWAQTISAMTHTIKVDESAKDIFVRLYALQRKVYRDIVRDLDPNAFEDDDLPFA